MNWSYHVMSLLGKNKCPSLADGKRSKQTVEYSHAGSPVLLYVQGEIGVFLLGLLFFAFCCIYTSSYPLKIKHIS